MRSRFLRSLLFTFGALLLLMGPVATARAQIHALPLAEADTSFGTAVALGDARARRGV